MAKKEPKELLCDIGSMHKHIRGNCTLIKVIVQSRIPLTRTENVRGRPISVLSAVVNVISQSRHETLKIAETTYLERRCYAVHPKRLLEF